MGMYSTSKEIQAKTLAKLLARPLDEAFVDGLLFLETTNWGWSEEANQIDESAAAGLQFTCEYISMSDDDKRQLGELDLGKHNSGEFSPLEPFRHFLRLADVDDDKIISQLLSLSDNPATWQSLPIEPTALAGHQPQTVIKGKVQLGFATSVPCYGINGYSTPAELADCWNLIKGIFDRHPNHVSQFLDQYGEFIRYYYGCAMRGSAELDVMW